VKRIAGLNKRILKMMEEEQEIAQKLETFVRFKFFYCLSLKHDAKSKEISSYVIYKIVFAK